jgi:hypothetical protein
MSFRHRQTTHTQFKTRSLCRFQFNPYQCQHKLFRFQRKMPQFQHQLHQFQHQLHQFQHQLHQLQHPGTQQVSPARSSRVLSLTSPNLCRLFRYNQLSFVLSIPSCSAPFRHFTFRSSATASPSFLRRSSRSAAVVITTKTHITAAATHIVANNRQRREVHTQ